MIHITENKQRAAKVFQAHFICLLL